MYMYNEIIMFMKEILKYMKLVERGYKEKK